MMTTTITSNEIVALEERYQLATYKKMPIVAERGEGVWIYASDGERYLDLYGGDAVGGGGGRPPPRRPGTFRKKKKKGLFFPFFFFSKTAPPPAKKGGCVAP